ncbi:UPF0348 protein [Lactococcus hodotermopsidis]|uniref:tRNA(Met) cytidine acetate ligase n=2 Tax=Pseudolactococcus hodotermopsidis TaxID=2709157 RepID=A0A6A0BFV7_9LACT|nr:UPF0348 protein [Lactococcus hodotermopsidis]
MISGIVAEFNPFHNGHKYLLEQACGLKIVIMSGNWLQRGEPAIIDKWVRADMALGNGADIVVEMPVFSSVQSADFFAKYAIEILAELGCQQLVFGTDADAIDYDKLREIYSKNAPAMQDFLKMLPQTLSYPQKTQKMWQKFAAVTFAGDTPNHILGLAYTKAAAEFSLKMRPIKRLGAGFHDDSLCEFASATAIREHVGVDLSAVMPNFASFQTAPKVQWSDYFSLLKYRILSADLTDIFQMNEELAARLKSAILTASDFDTLVAQVATKRYTKARVKRLLVYTLLNVGKSQTFELNPPHILGFSKVGQEHLKNVDVVTRIGKAYKDRLTLRADAIYRLGNSEIPEQNYGRRPIITQTLPINE